MLYGSGICSNIIFPGKSSMPAEEWAHMLMVNFALNADLLCCLRSTKPQVYTQSCGSPRRHIYFTHV